MLKLQPIALALALMAGTGSAAAAYTATNYSIGNISNAGSFSASVIDISPGTWIDDNWSFSLTGGDNQVVGLLTSVFLTSGIKNFGATLTGPDGFSADWDFFTERPIQVGIFEGTLGSGNYNLHVFGSALSPTSYAVNLAATAPVPEPESYAMMLAGLGMLGFMARRRMSN